MWVPEPTLALPPLLPSVPPLPLHLGPELQVTAAAGELAVPAGQPLQATSNAGQLAVSAGQPPTAVAVAPSLLPSDLTCVFRAPVQPSYCPRCPDAVQCDSLFRCCPLRQPSKRPVESSSSSGNHDARDNKRRATGWKDEEARHIAEHMLPGGPPRKPIALPHYQNLFLYHHTCPDARERSYLEMIAELSSRIVVWIRNGRQGPVPKITPKVSVDW